MLFLFLIVSDLNGLISLIASHFVPILIYFDPKKEQLIGPAGGTLEDYAQCPGLEKTEITLVDCWCWSFLVGIQTLSITELDGNTVSQNESHIMSIHCVCPLGTPSPCWMDGTHGSGSFAPFAAWFHGILWHLGLETGLGCRTVW